MKPPTQYCTAPDGVSIAYGILGDGQPLVVASSVFGELNMSPADAGGYRLYRELGRKVVVYDGRGMGGSDRSASDYTLDARLTDLEAVADHLELDDFPLYGHTAGVVVALAYAARHPTRASHLVLVNGAASGREWYNSVPSMRIAASLTDMAEDEWESMTMAVAGAVTDYANTASASTIARMFRDGMSGKEYLLWRRRNGDTDVTALLPQIHTKTLLVDLSGYVTGTLPLMRKMASAMPDASLVETTSEDATRVVREFLGDDAAPVTKIERPAGGFATILFTDMASSTSLTQRLGDAKAQELRRAHNDIVRAALSENSGAEIKHTGDGIMASFSTASSALATAIAIQRGVAEHRTANPDAPLAVYVGLNAGEPIEEDQDLFGTSVDLARRVCDQAEPGQILVSNVVRELAAGKEFLFADRGDVALKGFEEPVRVFEVRWQD